MVIKPGDFEDDRVKALLKRHLEGMHASSPAGHVFALDWSGLQRPEISFYTVWEGEELLGFGALKALDSRSGEIKSMRTADAHLRKGVAATILDHIIGEARARGYTRLSLETGSGPAFEPALALYRKRGFINGGAFGGYEKSTFNQFLHLDLVSTGGGTGSDAPAPPPQAANLGLIRPPFVYLGAIGLGLAIHALWPVPLLPRALATPIGAALTLTAVALFVTAVRTFRAAGTPVPGNQPTTTVVRTGPYRFSRNPIYLAFSVLQLGLAFWVNSLAQLLTLVPAVALMSAVVIAREERYLEALFPSEYGSYRASVRRWL
jgi:putative acetyltransferase